MMTYIESSAHPLSDLSLLASPARVQADQHVVVCTGLLHYVHGQHPVAETLEVLHHDVAEPALTSVHDDLPRHGETDRLRAGGDCNKV